MFSREKKEDKHVFIDGINTSTASALLPPTQARYILNCYTVSTGVGNVGIVVNTKGNTQISTPLPVGENKCIGTAVDEEDNFFYFFVWNENGFHTIFQYNALTKTVISLIQSITDTGGIDVLNFNKDRLILMTDVRGDKLYWVDGWNDARKINIKKALDKSNTGYGAIVLEEYINAYKKQPYNAPTASYFSDVNVKFNRMYGASRKFASLFVYDDLERSVYSDFSDVVNPIKESFTGVNTIPTDNNAIDITVETGSHLVTKIEIAMFQPSEDVPFPTWVTIAVLDKKKLGISDNSTYTYRFYNDGGSYTTVVASQIIKPYSYLPVTPLCQCIARNAMVYSNFPEGFPDVPLDVSLDVTYEPLFIEDGVENKFNSPIFTTTDLGVSDFVGKFGQYYTDLNGTIMFAKSARSVNGQRVVVGNDVKKGNTFSYNIKNGVNSYPISVTATVTDTATTIANKLIARLVATELIIRSSNGNSPIGDTYIYKLEDDGSGNISFKFLIIDYYENGYFSATASVNPVQFNTLKDTGQSVSNIKLGAGIKYGFVYGDKKGRRRSLVYTTDALTKTTATQNDLGGIQAVRFNLTVRHQPPVWAEWYEIVRTDDLTYGDFIQMIVQNVVEVQATNSGGDYLDLVVGSLYTYQKIHPNTTLKYEFKKGDRVRLIQDELGAYYPNTELEVLEYKDIADDLVNSNLTVDGTNNVTVQSASADNIGKYIVVDGNERLITGSTPTTYTVNAPIGKTGQDPYLSYRLVDRRGVIRVRKPNGVTITNQSLVEIFTPSLNNSEGDLQQFYHFNKKFDILNSGLPNRYHSANQQNQSATAPAIIKITEGTVFVRNREMPITNTIPNAQVIIKVIEDTSYSDFYYSRLNDNGRVNVEDNGLGVVQFGDRMRFSNIELENTAINGLNDFANLDREDYPDMFGSFVLTKTTENQILAFKYLKCTIVPVYQTVIQDNSGQDLLGASKKLLNDIRYYSYDGGIGRNPESYCRNENNHYFVCSSRGEYIRLGGDGATPISKPYGIDNEARRLLQGANLNKAKIYGGFDKLLNAPVWAIEGYNERSYFQGFNEGDWELLSDAPPEDSVFTIVTPPVSGTLTFPNGNPLYTNNGTVGADSFTYSTTIDGDVVLKKVCLNITDVGQVITAWRVKESSAYCVQEPETLAFRGKASSAYCVQE